MSRSNSSSYNFTHHNFYRDAETEAWVYDRIPVIPEREVLGRRTWVRRKRHPDWSRGSWHNTPPASWWKLQHRRARARQRAEFLRNPDDPMITPMVRLVNLSAWY